jgi:hypothetical protein
MQYSINIMTWCDWSFYNQSYNLNDLDVDFELIQKSFNKYLEK